MEESEIRIPSELIADEYLRKDNETGALYFFSDNNYKYFDDDSKRAFRICGFDIKKENQFLIDTKENVLNILDKITNENHKETSCFILLFFGTIGSNNDEYITESGDKIRGYEIWGKIMKCETLKYRPKIIIFQGFRVINTTQTDSSNSRKSLPIPTPPDYDIPYYSDMLITYKVTEGPTPNSTYFHNLWRNIVENGSRDDLTNIIAYTKRCRYDDFPPITTSTLRKKFFIKPSQFRIHWYDIHKNIENMKKNITMLENKLKLQGSVSCLDGNPHVVVNNINNEDSNRKKSKNYDKKIMVIGLLLFGVMLLISKTKN